MSVTPQREPNVSSVPDGSRTLPYDRSMTGLGEYFSNIALFPFSLPQVYDRLTNSGEISVATDSVVTNGSPGFLYGLKRESAETIETTESGAKTLASSVGGVVTSLFPWWLWALLGLGLVAYIITILAPSFRRQ